MITHAKALAVCNADPDAAATLIVELSRKLTLIVELSRKLTLIEGEINRLAESRLTAIEVGSE